MLRTPDPLGSYNPLILNLSLFTKAKTVENPWSNWFWQKKKFGKKIFGDFFQIKFSKVFSEEKSFPKTFSRCKRWTAFRQKKEAANCSFEYANKSFDMIFHIKDPFTYISHLFSKLHLALSWTTIVNSWSNVRLRFFVTIRRLSIECLFAYLCPICNSTKRQSVLLIVI